MNLRAAMLLGVDASHPALSPLTYHQRAPLSGAIYRRVAANSTTRSWSKVQFPSVSSGAQCSGSHPAHPARRF